MKSVDSSISPTLVLPSSHPAHSLEQDKGLLGHYFLEKHMLSCHTVHCNMNSSTWDLPEVSQCVTPATFPEQF